MRDLDSTNPGMLRPSKFGILGPCTALAIAMLTIPLAYGAAPKVKFVDNPLVLLLLVISIISLLLMPTPAIFRWGWQARHYGFSILCSASISLLAIVPFLAVIFYGEAPLGLKLFVLLFYVATHYLWCRNFARIYKDIFEDADLRSIIYQEESDAVYYMRRGDEFLLEKFYKFSQMPRDRYIAISIGLAIFMMPITRYVTMLMGVPFVHVFLLVAMVPISCMGCGIAFRGFLIFYFYPAKIKKVTGKDVYVDIVGKHKPLRKHSHKTMA